MSIRRSSPGAPRAPQHPRSTHSVPSNEMKILPANVNRKIKAGKTLSALAQMRDYLGSAAITYRERQKIQSKLIVYVAVGELMLNKFIFDSDTRCDLQTI